jgi:(2R)-sulfolactate sulfo-lyase subunit beta
LTHDADAAVRDKPTILGYRRADGRVGVRNHVVIIPVDDISNRAAEMVAGLVPGTLHLPHAYGRLQFGADLELHFRTLAGLGSNPNVAAVIVIGIEPVWTQRLVTRIAASGKPTAAFAIAGHGDMRTAIAAAHRAQRFLQDASEQLRESCGLAELVVSAKCGESDTTTGIASNPTVGWVFDRLNTLGATLIFGETSELTGGEDIVAERCRTPAFRQAFLDKFKAYNDDIVLHKNGDMLESNPTRGNMEGGISTIEEKALGALTKIGRNARIVGVVDTAVAPHGPGLWFMDSSGAGAEMLTACAAAGAVVHLFTTGQGNVVGNPLMPVIKLTANPEVAASMPEHIDVDVSGLLQRKMTLDQAGQLLEAHLLRTCNGRLTATESLGHRELSMTRLFRTA